MSLSLLAATSAEFARSDVPITRRVSQESELRALEEAERRLLPGEKMEKGPKRGDQNGDPGLGQMIYEPC